MCVFFGILLALLMLRDENVGVDIKTYLYRFNQVRKMSFEGIFDFFESERGFWILNKIISLFTKDEQAYLAIMALITTLPIAILYIKESENAVLSMSIFLILSNFSMLFSGLRQATALAVVAIAFYFVKKKKPIWFILFVLLAFTFHKSALIALLLYPFYHMNITKNKIFAFIPAIILVLIFNKPIFEFLLQFMGDYGEIYEYEETGAYTMIILFALFLTFAYFVPDENKMDRETMGLRNISVLVLMLQIFALANPVAMRMNYYFMMFIPLMMPKVINRCAERNRSIIQYIGIGISVFFLIYYIYGINTGADILEIYPYKPYW